MMSAILLLLLSALMNVSNCCSVSEDDPYIIASLLQKSLSSNWRALQNLSKAFFAVQEHPPHSVKVHYLIQIPINKECEGCNCWNNASCNSTGTCPDGYCCIVKDFLWGRVPMVVQDDIYRAMTICPFIIGSSTERSVAIKLTLSDQNGMNCDDGVICGSFPCAWCSNNFNVPMFRNDLYDGEFFDFVLKMPTLKEYTTPSIDIALITLTEKVY